MGFKPDLRPPTGFLQCFDTAGLVIWPVKIILKMTYYVSSGTLNRTHSLTPTLILTRTASESQTPSGQIPGDQSWLWTERL